MEYVKLLMSLSALIYVITIFLAGLDPGRFQQAQDFKWHVSIPGVILTVVGQVLFLTARKQNNFFSTVVRIQKEGGHFVCESGLNKIVRHPGYLEMIISLTGLPLITTSSWSIIPKVIAVVLLCIRTSHYTFSGFIPRDIQIDSSRFLMAFQFRQIHCLKEFPPRSCFSHLY
jgi:protein-S-isoprenylcysteine O-methyltransferase Ste14